MSEASDHRRLLSGRLVGGTPRARPRDLVKIKLAPDFGHAVARRVGHPAVDLGFAPAGAVNADRYLWGERPFRNLTIDG